MKRLQVCLDPSTGLHRLVDSDGSLAVKHANAYLKSLTTRGLSPQTVRSYAYDILAIYRWLDSYGRRLEQLCQADLLDFVEGLRLREAKPRSVNRGLVVCRLLYRHVAGKEMPAGVGSATAAPYYRGRGRDHTLGLHVLPRHRPVGLQVRVARTLVEPLSVEQVRAFLRGVRRYRDLALIQLMLLCGLRSGEVLSLKLADLTVEDRRIRVNGKGNRERSMPVPDALLDVLQKYFRYERPTPCDTSFMFVNLQGERRGTPMTAAGLRSLFRRHRRRGHLQANANPHRWRHTFGSDMARAGVRLPVLQKMMGHAHPQTTLQYVNLSMDDVAQEYLRACRRLDQRYACITGNRQ